MIKKLITGALVVAVLGMSSTTFSYANNNINRNQAPARRVEYKTDSIKSRIDGKNYFFEVLDPEKNIISTDKNMLLSFRASEGTKVKIEVYHSIGSRDNKENYLLSYEPMEITIGAFQKGWASVDLKPGLNKILFVVKYKNEPGDSIERVINVMEVQEVKRLLQDVVNKSTLGRGKR